MVYIIRGDGESPHNICFTSVFTASRQLSFQFFVICYMFSNRRIVLPYGGFDFIDLGLEFRTSIKLCLVGILSKPNTEIRYMARFTYVYLNTKRPSVVFAEQSLPNIEVYNCINCSNKLKLLSSNF